MKNNNNKTKTKKQLYAIEIQITRLWVIMICFLPQCTICFCCPFCLVFFVFLLPLSLHSYMFNKYGRVNWDSLSIWCTYTTITAMAIIKWGNLSQALPSVVFVIMLWIVFSNGLLIIHVHYLHTVHLPNCMSHHSLTHTF